MTGVALGGFDAPRSAWLALRRPHARRLYAHRLQVGDVVHAPSEPLEVVAPPEPLESGAVVYTALGYHRDGTPYEVRVALWPVRDADGVRRPPTVLASRPSAVPERLRDVEGVSPTCWSAFGQA